MKCIKYIFLLFFTFFSLLLFSQITFKPTDVTGLQLWLSSDTGITLNGGDVQQWADRSGNGKDATQPTVSDQPLFVPGVNILNGFPTVRFNGTSDRMLINSGLNIGSVFIVLNWNGGPAFTEENCILSKQVYTPYSVFR